MSAPAKKAGARAPTGAALAEAEARRMSGQRMRLLEHHPFWGHLLLHLRLVPDPTLPAIAATDCLHHIWYDPRRTRALDPDQLGFVLAHEVGHLVQASLPRARGRDARLWNMATDYAINRIVAGIPHPGGRGALYRPVPGILLDRRFDGMIAEAIYERLVAAAEPIPAPRVRLRAAGYDTEDHGGGLDVHLPEGLSEEEREELGERVRAAIAHAASQPVHGDVPGEVLRAFAAPTPRLRWPTLLRQFVEASRTLDAYDARRPERRRAEAGVVVPSLSGERVGRIVVALDTSGSVPPKSLAAACAEIRALAASADELRVVVADAKVQEVVDLDGLEDWLRRGRARGGGGTDHRPVFAWIAASGFLPDVFIGFTDLHTVLPSGAPPYPVVWVAPRGHGPARFGAVIPVDA